MYYIFMDNFRGFSKTIIPLHNATFLVGENSTGKSSFLSLVYLFSDPQFLFKPDFSSTDFCNLGGFKDIVSAGSSNKKQFTVGFLSISEKKKDEAGIEKDCDFILMTFRDEEGIPVLYKYINYIENKIVKIIFMPKTIRYKIIDQNMQGPDDESLTKLFMKIFNESISDSTGFKTLPKNIPPYLPIPFVLSFIQSAKKTFRIGNKITISSKFPSIIDLTWLAPIRTKPKRIYEGFKKKFSPEGDHIPHIIRKTLKSRENTRRKFLELLSKYGNSSGLFKNINTHAFGNDPAAPFEVLVEIFEQSLNISNVGYGISQVLPVVIEMLTGAKNRYFAIQQPEIHLHPRAQAAFGDLIHQLILERQHYYIVETHSDYLIDRFRHSIKESGKPKDSKVIFFERFLSGNRAHILGINEKGQYPTKQPKGFREFFIHEEMRLLEI